MSGVVQGTIIQGDPSLTTAIALPSQKTLFGQLSTQMQQIGTALRNARDHAAALAEQQALSSAIAALQPAWAPLPYGPYPPDASDTSFPRTGDTSQLINASTISAAQLGEPARVAKGLADSALARRPQVSALFWVGLACLGVGIYLAKK